MNLEDKKIIETRGIFIRVQLIEIMRLFYICVTN